MTSKADEDSILKFQALSRPSALTLPPEIVSEIFLHSLPTPHHCRQIALSTPQFWRAIQIHTDSPSIQDQKLQVVDQWLLRARTCSVSLSLKCLEPEMLEIVVAHCEKWEDVEIEVTPRYWHMIQGEMPLLRRLTIGPGDSSYDHNSTKPAFHRAPFLTHVVLTARCDPASIGLPWAQLTHLETCTVYGNEFTDTLLQSTSLVHCTMRIHPYIPNSDFSGAPLLSSAFAS
ncbi:hypothetical protein C8R43DRAFT_1192837 [Mycena crocata]|nr:hypothetical protein C8R43DRAFT_1192837 [Mycena crocata]